MLWNAPSNMFSRIGNDIWPSGQATGQTPSASQTPKEHLKTHDPSELSLFPSKPNDTDLIPTTSSSPEPPPHLLLLDHYQEWQTALYSTTGKAKSSTAQILASARRLAVFSLKLLTESKCLSNPNVDPNVDIPPKHLTKTLSAAETSLSELSRHMQDLMGNGPLNYGPLGMEMGYRKGTKELADPKNLEDTIEELIQKVRSKLKTMDAQKSSLEPNPVRDTTWESISPTAMTIDPSPQQVTSLFLLEHFHQWKDTIDNENSPMSSS